MGDDVWGIDDLGAGSHAEYLTIAASGPVMRIPSGVTYQAAAACLEGGWYALSILERANFEKGGAS